MKYFMIFIAITATNAMASEINPSHLCQANKFSSDPKFAHLDKQTLQKMDNDFVLFCTSGNSKLPADFDERVETNRTPIMEDAKDAEHDELEIKVEK